MTSTDPSLNDVPDDDPRGLRDYAEREAKRANEAHQELADLKKKDAFRDAGLDPTNPLHSAVIAGYDGEIGQVGDFVTGLGLTNSNNTPPAPAIPDTEREALERAANLTSGDPAPPSVTSDGNARLRDITMRAVGEKWPAERFNREFTDEMIAQHRQVGQMDIVVNHGAEPN